MTGRSFVFEGYGVRARLGVPGDFDVAELKRHVASEVQVEDDSKGPLDLLLTCWNGTYHLVYGERRYGPYGSVEGAMRGVSNGIHFVLGKRSPMTFLHAGAVEIDGNAVIFPGRSRWGKSTLVASLVEQGCGYMSDEYAVISQHGTVFPLSKPIRLRKAGGAVHIDPPGVSAPGGLHCSALILTRFEEGAQWAPESMTSGAAILETLPCALQSRECSEQVLASLAALVRGAECYRSSRGNFQPTAESIMALVGDRLSSKEMSL
jgi:hypothetical protein